MERGVDLGKHVAPMLKHQADLIAADPLVFQVLQQGVGLLAHGQHFAAAADVDLARRGECDPVVAADEQLQPQFPFQLEQLLVQRRGGQVELLGRFGDVFAIGNGDKIFLLFQIHRAPPAAG